MKHTYKNGVGTDRATSRGRTAFTSIAVAAMLAACGGGGSSGPTTLALDADAATAQAGGTAIAVHATVANSNATPTWSLSGPGSLSATSGASVNYVPPDLETASAAGTATITATVDGVSQSTQIAVSAVTVPGHQWNVAVPPSANWRGMAYANGLFVVVGSDGALASSPDGVTWTRHDTVAGELWQTVTFGAHGWIAVGWTGELATSADGLTWSVAATPLIPPSTLIYNTINGSASGNGAYVAVGGSKSYASTDGVTWTTVNEGFNSVAFGNGVFVATSTDAIYTSTDGVTWASTGFNGDTTPPPTGGFGLTVVFGNGEFLAMDAYGRNFSSTDGRTWAATAATAQIDPEPGIFFANGSFYSISATGSLQSTDGPSAWTPQSAFPFSVSNLFGGIAASPSEIVAVNEDGTIAAGPDTQHLARVVAPSLSAFNAIDQADGLYIATTMDGAILTSPDAVTWTPVTVQTSVGSTFVADYGRHTAVLAHAPDGTIVVGGSSVDLAGAGVPYPAPAYAWSQDGVHWSATSTPIPQLPNDVIHDGTRFVSVDGANVNASANGHDWTVLYTFPAEDLGIGQAVAFGGGRYVVAGMDGLASTSTDGAAWSAPATVNGSGGTPLNFTAVSFANGRFVAVADDGEAATSTDGTTWTVVATATTHALRAITATAQGVLVATGDFGVIETSVDGAHWTLRTSPASQSIRAVAATSSGVIAVGDDNLVETSTQ